MRVNNRSQNTMGERTYKYDMFCAGAWANGYGGMNVSLQIDKLMLYPNGYLNMNQDGEYTKHYYADALRIASKIGSGFSQNLCDETFQIDDQYPGYLDERRNEQYNEMMEELTELINENQIIGIKPLPYPNPDLCNLFGNGHEPALFFYHPDHLGSTGMVTDNNATVTQGFLYTPFGELLYEYSPGWQSGIIPKYSFNAKELDEENGMYYYSARYYAPPTFISRDEKFEEFPTISPYSYCKGNPVILVDPDGRDVIYIAFPKYRANGIPFTGHAGVLLIDNKTGLTKYYEYGRYDKEGKGIVRTVPVSNVVIGKDGKPTTESLNKVMKQISDKSGHGGDIEGAYIISDKFKEMNDYAKGKMSENSDPERKKYSILSNNCATFAEDVITQDESVDKPTSIINSPVNIVDEYQEEGNARVQYKAKTQTTTIGTGNEKDAKVKKRIDNEN